MKTYLILLLITCQSIAASAQNNENKVPYLTKSLSGDAINSVFVNTSGGGIQVSGAAGQQPRIEVFVHSNNGGELLKNEAKKRIEEGYDLDISVSGHELHAVVKNKHENDHWDWKRSVSISFRIYVPQQVNTDLQTSGGGIILDNLKGNEKFSTSGGGLHIDKLSGMIRGRTSGGGIEVSNSNEDIDLSTSGGGITASNCSGEIKLITSGGGIRLQNLKGRIKAETSAGSVEGSNIEGELVTGSSGGGINLRGMNCSLEAYTSAGSLRAQINHVGKYLKLNASSGNIDLELPLKQGLDLNLKGDRINQHPWKINDFTGDWDNNHIKGTVNGGGAIVTADASSGGINVRFN